MAKLKFLSTLDQSLGPHTTDGGKLPHAKLCPQVLDWLLKGLLIIIQVCASITQL